MSDRLALGGITAKLISIDARRDNLLLGWKTPTRFSPIAPVLRSHRGNAS
jgi:hypothetical protein